LLCAENSYLRGCGRYGDAVLPCSASPIAGDRAAAGCQTQSPKKAQSKKVSSAHDIPPKLVGPTDHKLARRMKIVLCSFHAMWSK
jgi:hypothetical protein